ncbi:MAG: Mrp/NBP35 family ATP-binding protein [Maricaulaceae bacterium]|jgi:ATP-binding protein involved in chromosome partitioning
MVESKLSAVREALATLQDPAGGGDIVLTGRVKGLTARDGRVGFVIELGPEEDPAALEPLRAEAEAAVAALPGVSRVTAVLTAHAEAPGGGSPAQAPQAPPRQAPPRQAPSRQPPGRQSGHGPIAMPGVGALLAVASGKGGVGKSTVAANLACALARKGKRVGLLDADVFGPSSPILMGLEGAKLDADKDKRIIPPTAYGVKVMSIGFMSSADSAMIWRGPMVMSAVSQLLGSVAWAPLDILVLDLPPGTGDAQLTLAQRAPLTGAVIVSTPQKLALADVRRGVEMFSKVSIPILGVIENMSSGGDEDPSTAAPFGAGGARAAADTLGAPYLGALPLDPELARASDAGEPPAALDPDGPMGRRFAAMADALLAGLAADPARKPPQIVFE